MFSEEDAELVCRALNELDDYDRRPNAEVKGRRSRPIERRVWRGRKMSTDAGNNTMINDDQARQFRSGSQGQITALFIGAGVAIQHDWSIGCAVGFSIMVLVDIPRPD